MALGTAHGDQARQDDSRLWIVRAPRDKVVQGGVYLLFLEISVEPEPAPNLADGVRLHDELGDDTLVAALVTQCKW